MSGSVTILIIVIAVAVLLILVALVLAWQNKRTAKRRAGVIRDKATEQSHQVGQREALADETAAKSRAARAESEAMAAHAAGLEHEAQQRSTDALSARGEVNREYERADKIDPGVETGDRPPRQATGKHRQIPSHNASSGPPTSAMESGSPHTTSWSRARDRPT